MSEEEEKNWSPDMKRAMQKARVRMEAFKNRVIPDALTDELLGKTPDDKLPQLVMDYVCNKIRHENPEDMRAFVQQLSPGVRSIYVARCVEGEVGNGGFHQFFYNSSGQLAVEAIQSFEILGLPAFADLMRRAITVFREETDMQFRIRLKRTVESFFGSYGETKLARLDKKFYALDPRRSHTLEKAYIKYIKEHRNEFITTRTG